MIRSADICAHGAHPDERQHGREDREGRRELETLGEASPAGCSCRRSGRRRYRRRLALTEPAHNSRNHFCHTASPLRLKTASSTTEAIVMATIATNVPGSFLTMSTAKNASTIAVTAMATTTSAALLPVSARLR
jgi:hypothetical protein